MDPLRIYFPDREVERGAVLEWERRRARAVLRKLGVRPIGDDLPTLHDQLLERKLQLGPDGLRQRLRRELALSDVFAGLMARLSRGRCCVCTIELLTFYGRADRFLAWFGLAARGNDDATMLSATPDHYLLRTDERDVMEIIETTGGSPVASRFFVDPADRVGLQTPEDASFPLRFAGVARTKSGRAIGGVYHQFRDEGEGFRARLAIEFPALMPAAMIRGHQWHLASEFGNWVLAYLNSDMV